MQIEDEDAFFEALDANEALPYGKERSARAEALVGAAERLGRTELLAWALLRLVTAYNYGGESPRSPVPLSRLLKLWDEHPEEFDERLTHHLFWDLKWVTSSLLSAPEVPLPAIRGYLADMERRYSVAGHSLRPVHQSRFYLARHIGDEVGAAAAFEDWTAAERDRLADCHACERREQGRWLISRGADADALELFGPTLQGELSCAEEPQVTLAESLLPLVRVGCPDEARTNHLRGYRQVRGKVSTYGSVAQHIEFCALTGNEGRGVEILAEHRAWLGRAQSDRSDHLSFLSGVAVLLRRLVAVGGPDLPVYEDTTAGPLLAEVERELFAICAAFDARNGNDAVTSRARQRIEAEPVAASLPLGLRAVPVAPAAAAFLGVPGVPGVSAAVPVSSGPSADDLEGLRAHAEDLEEHGHPRTLEVWRRYAAACAAREVPLDARARGVLAEQEGAELANSDSEDDAETARARFAEAEAAYTEAGDEGRALAARIRIALLRSGREGPESPEVAALLDTAYAEASAMLPGDPVPFGLVLHGRAFVAMSALLARRAALEEQHGEERHGEHAHGDSPEPGGSRGSGASDGESAAGADDASGDASGDAVSGEEPADAAARAALDAALTELHDRGMELGLRHRAATALAMRGETLLREGRQEEAEADLAAAVGLFRKAGRPWAVVGPLFLLGQVRSHHGEPAEAEAHLREVVTAAAEYPRPPIPLGHALTTLANALAAQGRLDEAVSRAYEAAHHFDADDDPGMAASCRSGAARMLMGLDRQAEAAAILEETLPAIEEHLGAEAAMHDRYGLGMALRQAGDAREAARHLAIAAEASVKLADRATQAEIALAAAHALTEADMSAQADAAFGRAIELLREQGPTRDLVRALRARAWNLADGSGSDDPAPTDRAVALFGEALRALEADPEAEDRAAETASTHHQLAHLLTQADRYHPALAAAGRAADAYLPLLPGEDAGAYVNAVCLAARLEAFALSDTVAATARVEAALKEPAVAGLPAEVTEELVELSDRLRAGNGN